MSDDFLGGSSESIQLKDVGDSCDGKLLRINTRDDVSPDGTVHRWDDGTPKKVFLWELETSEGTKTLWVRGNLVTALREAAKTAGAREQGDMIGARVQVKHHALGEPKSKGFNKPKLYQAKITLAPPEERGSDNYDPFAE